MKEIPAYIETGSAYPTKMGETIGLRTSKYKYLRNRNDENRDVRLFDLKQVPFENNNIANFELVIVQSMEAELKKIKKGNKKDMPDDLSKEEIKKIEYELKKLGYL